MRDASRFSSNHVEFGCRPFITGSKRSGAVKPDAPMHPIDV
jgi:hypothetical protein